MSEVSDEEVNVAAAVWAFPATGKIDAAGWDFGGVGAYPTSAQIAAPVSLVILKQRGAFRKPDTTLRAYSQREWNATDSRCAEPKPRARAVIN